MRDVSSGDDDCSDDSNGDSDGDADSGDGDSGDDDSNSNSGGGDSDSGGKKQRSTKTCSGRSGDGGQCSPRLNPSSLLSCATSVQGGAESIILSVHAESIILSAQPALSMILSAPPAESIILSACGESIILSAGGAESIILSAGGAKQQSTLSCSKNVGTMAAAEATVAAATDLMSVAATTTAVKFIYSLCCNGKVMPIKEGLPLLWLDGEA
jgi:hypothetical protein